MSKSKSPQVSIDLWKSLYQVAGEYLSLTPWKVVSEDDLFAVHDPVSNKINYCCVLGEAGEFSGLTLYRGREGLEMHLQIKEDNFDPENSEIIDLYDAIVVEFCDRKELDKEDLIVIKQLGMEFSKKEPHPQFRSFLPGYLPWYLNTEEVQLLTLALMCAVNHVKQCMTDSNFKRSVCNNDKILLYSQKQPDSRSVWEISWHTPGPLLPKQFDAFPIDQQKIWALKSKSKSADTVWESRAFLIPDEIITDSTRPYFLRIVMIADEGTGEIIHTEPVQSFACPYINLRDTVLSTMESLKQLPSKILVLDENAFRVLSPLKAALGIEIETNPCLPVIERAKEYLFQELNDRFDPALAGGPRER
ncbi:MAG: hypothetical protein HW387_105 [Parachlamydiales bacterium]|nr:hypothetical protein [Parachlamydiales bacterium]